MSNYREVLRYGEALHFLALLFCNLLYLATCGPCSMNSVRNPVEYDECGSYRDNLNSGFRDGLLGDFSQEVVLENPMALPKRLENVCTRSNLFCFPSTLPGFISEARDSELSVLEFSGLQSNAALLAGSQQATHNLSWSSNCDNFKLLSGRVVSCSLNVQENFDVMSDCQSDDSFQNDVSSCRGHLLDWRLQNVNQNKESVIIRPGLSDDSSIFYVEINPPLLDWGQKSLYFPSVAYLTVRNTHSDTALNVYEPYSSNAQFYPCNFSEMVLGPGEVASICFVYLPTWLGLSSAQLILQTSSGGFLIQARGFAVESPYGVQPLVGIDDYASGRWSKNLSLYNPFDETLYVQEVTAWISFSSGNISHSTKAICSVKNAHSSADPGKLRVKEWLDVKSCEVGLPVMAMRLHRNWEVGPNSSDTIVELDFHHFQGKVLGSFFLQLLRPSKDEVDTVMVPLEAEIGRKSTYVDLNSSISVSVEVLVPCDAGGIVVSLLLENAAQHLLTVVKISLTGESTNSIQIKYAEGLILFPGSVTQAAVITYTPLDIQLDDPPVRSPRMNTNCKFLIATNESKTPLIEIPCSNIVGFCPTHQSVSSLGYGQQDEEVYRGSAETSSSDNNMQLPLKIKAMEMTEADELVLGNWRSQGTASGMSVLDDHEVLFPLVHVGSRHSKWITVKNPSLQPVIMQLILNSAEVIDECKESDGVLQSSSSSSVVHREYSTPTRYGFSIAEGALTEVYVHPQGSATLGPILFHPSSRCRWESSALVRNNLSGVEWLSLHGFGGSLSLLLFEGHEPVQTVELRYNLPSFLNFSPPDILSNAEGLTHACAQPLLKELYAKNDGDLPLKVDRIEVSGTACGLDGFIIHPCKGFALEPGESTKLIVSYRADLSAAMVQRDLELSLATGILVIPMKASLPISMLNMCRRSILWIQLKKSSVAILLAGFMMFLVFCCILPQVTLFGSQDYFKGGKNFIGTIRCAYSSSHLHHNQENGTKFAISTDMSGFLRANGEGKTPMLESVGRYPDTSVAKGQEKTAQHANRTVAHHVHTNCCLDSKKEVAKPSSLKSKSVKVESSVAPVTSPPENLTVKLEKEKGRRRRRKKSAGAGLTGQFEVSSSHSGNSTPSSPLSPISSFMPKRPGALSPDVEQSAEARNPFAHRAERVREKSSVTIQETGVTILHPKVSLKYGGNSLDFPTQEKPVMRRTVYKPILLPSATFPSTGRPSSNMRCSSPILPSTSTIAPHARAPGSKLYEQNSIKAEEKMGFEDEFKYDIWGDHLFGHHFRGKSNDVSVMSPPATGSNSSFFASGPQSLLSVSQAKLVSSNQEG